MGGNVSGTKAGGQTIKRRTSAEKRAVRLLMDDIDKHISRLSQRDREAMISSMISLFSPFGKAVMHADLKDGKLTDMVKMRFAMTVEAREMHDMRLSGIRADWYPQFAALAKSKMQPRQ